MILFHRKEESYCQGRIIICLVEEKNIPIREQLIVDKKSREKLTNSARNRVYTMTVGSQVLAMLGCGYVKIYSAHLLVYHTYITLMLA